MMRCLEAGGLEAVYDHVRDELNVLYGKEGYLPNPNGFYEIGNEREFFGKSDFTQVHDGKLMKCSHSLLLNLPYHAYRIVFMLRNPAEIRTSMKRFSHDWPCDEVASDISYNNVISSLMAGLAARGDMDIVTLQYANVVSNPRQEFASLNWPIDHEKAAAMVQPELYRCREPFYG